MNGLCVALPGGALMVGACRLLSDAQVADITPDRFDRNLLTDVAGHRFVKIRPTDIPIYVEMGACHAGIVGKDVLWEDSRERYELLDLGFGGCRLVLAAPAGSAIAGGEWPSGVRVGTKYVSAAQRFFDRRRLAVDLIKLHGSVELSPAVGLVDAIVDIVASGRTLAANHLVEVVEADVSTARLIVNSAAMKTKFASITALTASLRAVGEGRFPASVNADPGIANSRTRGSRERTDRELADRSSSR